jgi:hypothetical protein
MNRYIPVGYRIEDGQYKIHSEEADMVRTVFERYRAGDSLNTIADLLNGRNHISGCAVNWNKARVKRIIEDERYLGGDTYPLIIEKRAFEKANEKKNGKSIVRDVRSPLVEAIIRKTVCHECGKPYLRHFDARRRLRWHCADISCHSDFRIDDEFLINNLNDAMSMIIKKLRIVETQVETETTYTETPEIADMQARLDITLRDGIGSAEEIRRKILEITMLKYTACSSQSSGGRTKDLKNSIKALWKNECTPELIDTAIEKTAVGKDGTLYIYFINGQVAEHPPVRGGTDIECNGYTDKK